MFFQSLHFNGKGCNKQFANIPSDTEDLEFMLNRARHSQGSARREIEPVGRVLGGQIKGSVRASSGPAAEGAISRRGGACASQSPRAGDYFSERVRGRARVRRAALLCDSRRRADV